MKRFSILLIISILAVMMLFTGGTKTAAEIYLVDFDEPRAEFLMLQAINTLRYQEGLPLLSLDERLSRVSRRHSIDMARRDYFDHFSPSGLSPTARANLAGIPNEIYENIGIIRTYGQDLEQVVDSLMRSFLASPRHRANILNPDITHVGIGFYQDLDNNNHRLGGTTNPELNYTGFGTVLVTQDFCRRRVTLLEPPHFDGSAYPGEYMTLVLDLADDAGEAFLRIISHNPNESAVEVPLVKSDKGYKARFAIESEGSFTVAIYANSANNDWFYREHGRLELTVKTRRR